MRPVTKPSAISPGVMYREVATFSFKKGKAKDLAQKLWKTKTPTVATALTTLQTINDKPKASRSPNEVTLKKAIDAQVSEEYKKAGTDLQHFIGSYCSYCETVITQLSEVEHVQPKSVVTSQSLKWDNFLFSCGPCNNSKHDTPSRETIQKAAGLTTRPTDAQYATELFASYVFPHIDAKSYRWTKYKLATVSGAGAVTPLPLAQRRSILHQNVVYDTYTRKVMADIYDPATNAYTRSQVRVFLDARVNGTDLTIKLAKLNELRGKSDNYDSRMLRRTQTWFFAIAMIGRLRELSNKPAKRYRYDNAWNQVMEDIMGKGFFSTWLTVFSLYPYATVFGENYDAKFTSLVNVPIPPNNFYPFPGTNKAKLP